MLRSSDYFLVIDGEFRVAREITSNEDGSITVDLFRNLHDLQIGAAIELDFTYWPEGVSRRQPYDRGYYCELHPGSSAGNPLH